MTYKVYINIYIYIYMYIYICIYIYVYVCVCVCVYAYSYSGEKATYLQEFIFYKVKINHSILELNPKARKLLLLNEKK